MDDLEPAPDSRAAASLVAGLRGFAESVLSVVPSGFEAYVRVFHPAYRHRAAVGWEEIAASTGSRFHAGMQLHAATGRSRFRNEAPPPPLDHWPDEGSLPASLAAALAAVLGRHTATPGRCWFAFWSGFAATRELDLMLRSPTFHAPHRDYFLLAGPVAAAARDVTDGPAFQSANLWWPDDRSWCVATEIDLDSTYVGCSEDCRRDLLAVSELEALPIDPATGIAYDSDVLNGGGAA